jgi:threonine synthase
LRTINIFTKISRKNSKPLNYYSTKHTAPDTTFREAVLKGLPDDNGLYMPSRIPALSADFVREIEHYGFADIAFQMAEALLGGDIPADRLRQIVDYTTEFDAPLVPLGDNVNILELFHGPTLAFKDYGARFMAQVMSYLVAGSGQRLHVLVATSGDTGSAVANGFLGLPNITVTVLYPKGKVSPFQEMQFTTLGQNITALEVDGTFDDCQRLVKEAFLDKKLNKELALSSANSINIARLIPQSFYYAHAYAQARQLHENRLPVVFSVPSGNFGNLTAGLLAQRMGIPIRAFVAATNANGIVPEYLQTGQFRPRPSVQTLSNAMDVGNPSNFARMEDLFHNSWHEMRHQVYGYAYDDEATREAVAEVRSRYIYLIDPHGALGYWALRDYMREHDRNICGIVLETAHPVKFAEIVEPIIGERIHVPGRIAHLLERPKQSLPLANDFGKFRQLLLDRLK